MNKSHLILIAALVLFAANTVRMTNTAHKNNNSAEYARYLRDCVDPQTGENYSTDTCVESKYWVQDE